MRRFLKHPIVLAASLALTSLTASCRQQAPSDHRISFQRDVIDQIDFTNLITWARSQLTTNNSGREFSTAQYPASIKNRRPLRLDIGTDIQSGSRFVYLYYKAGPEMEGIMIGQPGAQAGAYRYRYALTNGVYYFYGTN
jgi:hypothetical protein